MDKVDEAMEQLTIYQYETDNGFMDWLKENVNLMNFDEIVEILRK
jgi:hypothetical protein